jgi:hypothetical protein
MRYDDRITSVELNDTNELLALLNEEDTQAELAADQAREEYQCPSEYDDQEWLDKGNW